MPPQKPLEPRSRPRQYMLRQLVVDVREKPLAHEPSCISCTAQYPRLLGDVWRPPMPHLVVPVGGHTVVRSE